VNPRLSIIIPAFDEEATIGTLLQSVIDQPLESIEKQIIVVESNSKDRTRAIVRDFESRGLIQAIYQDLARGKGHAVKAGLAQATGEWILIQDADLEYKVSDYPRLLAPLQKGEAAFVLGSRHLGYKGWQYRSRTAVGPLAAIFINSGVLAFSWFFNVLYGVCLTDPTTMFKVFRRNCLEGITFKSDGFNLDWEIVGKLIRQGFIPIEIPVSYKSRGWNEGKKVRLVRDGWVSLKAIIEFRFSSL